MFFRDDSVINYALASLLRLSSVSREELKNSKGQLRRGLLRAVWEKRSREQGPR